MQEKNIDILLAYSDEADPGHVRYLTDYHPTFEKAIVIVPPEGHPILTVGPECESYARATSRIKDVRLVEDVQILGEEYPLAKYTSFKEIFKEIGSRRLNRLGIAGFDRFPAPIYLRLQQILPETEIVDASEIFNNQRMKKSQNELSCIKRSYELTDKAVEAVLSVAEAGKTECEIAATGENVMRSLGAEGTAYDTIVASGPNSRHQLARATTRRIRRGEIVLVCMGARYEGYTSCVAFPFVVGAIPSRLRKVMEIGLEAMERARATLKTGALSQDVYRAAREVVEKAGLVKYFPYGVAHTVGLTEKDASFPYMTPSSNYVLGPNEVWSIDIGLFGFRDFGFRFETGFATTEKDKKPLSKFKLDIFSV